VSDAPNPALIERFFAPCPRGLEPIVAQECADCGASDLKEIPGGVLFAADWAAAKRINLESRSASRVLWQAASGPARTEQQVYELALALPWDTWFSVNNTIRVATTGLNATVRSLDFVSLRIKDAVCDRFREVMDARPSVNTQRPDIRIQCVLTDRDCTLYLDMSGEALFKRGWREAGEAPLRENLAAGILKLAGWTPGTPLFDPMCGSGTFLIEAAQMAAGVPPGALHGFAFEKFLHRDASRPVIEKREPVPTVFAGSDIDGELVATARTNAWNAGLAEDAIRFDVKDARDVEPPCEAPGIVLMNPPYEERIGFSYTRDATEFFDAFAATMKRRFKGWTLYVLTTDMQLQSKMRLKPERRVVLFNGPLECRLYRFDLR
jgi:putative N6-adenine-specific DNA methylase